MTITVDDLRASLRQTEACILDADDDSLMIALRVPRKAVREHHALLAALSEAGVAWKHAPEPQATAHLVSVPGAIRASLASFYKALPAIAGLGVVALTAVFIGMTAIAELRGPAFELKDPVLLTPRVAVGGILRSAAYVRRPHRCDYIVNRAIKNARGDIVWRQEVTAAPIPVTSKWTYASIAVNLPPELGPGRYTYSAEILSRCGLIDEVSYFPPSGPPLTFEIIEK